MSRSVREALSYVRKILGGPQGCWEGLYGCPVVSGRPSRMSGSSRQALQDVREWSGGAPGCPGVVGRPSWLSRSDG